MGGHRGGEVASSLALETVQGMFERQEGSLAEQVAEANRAVFDRSQNDRSVSGMGTTLTAARVDGSQGASRARRATPGRTSCAAASSRRSPRTTRSSTGW
jgi:serine/threonine protein phosphatase PrpC